MIRAVSLNKYYGATRAINDLSFTIREGECVGFLGLNGAGKTTTLRILSGLTLPTSGRIEIDGIDFERHAYETRKLIGFLPDSPPLYLEMSPRSFLHYAGRIRGMSAPAIERRLPDVLDVCRLQSVADQPIATLSHGFKQRVGIAQAIIHEPRLLILDEPIQGLDPVQIVGMREMIRALRGKHTILLSTHILSEIEQTCDRILVLHQGRLAAEGTEDELRHRFGSRGSIEVDIHGSAANAEAAQKAIMTVANVTRVTVRAHHDDYVRLWVDASADARPEIARAIVNAGLGLLKLSQVESDLEAIFLRLSENDTGWARQSGYPPAPSASVSASAPS